MAVAAKMKSKKPPKPKINPDTNCALPGSLSCPFTSGKNSPYMYQTGCRGEACKSANREYYRAWRASKTTKVRLTTVPVKKSKAKAPTKKSIKKK
jgi:hypothetical protein